jgi:hypothetical protein
MGITFLIIVSNQRAVISFCKKEAIHLKYGSQEVVQKQAKPTRRRSPPTPKTGKAKGGESSKGKFP